MHIKKVGVDVSNEIVNVKMKRLWIVSELFYPSETSTAYILTEIANRLVDKYEVKVITCNGAYATQIGNNQQTLDDRVEVIYANTVKFGKNNLISRFVRLFLSGFYLYRTAKVNIVKDDKVLIVTNPAPIVPLIHRLKQKIGFTLNILVHDVFPENLKPAGIAIPEFIYNIVKRKYDRAYAAAEQLIVLGRDMQDLMQQKIRKYCTKTSISIVENWADIDIIKAEEPCCQDVVHIQYAGNIGRLQGLEHILALLNESAACGVQFDLWGNGAVEESLKLYVDKNNMHNVFFHGAYQRSQQSDVINSCDISLVTLSEGMYGLGVPSKTYNIMAAGRPILYIGNLHSEVALMINEHKIGFCYDPSDTDSIKSFFYQLGNIDKSTLRDMGCRARDLALTLYSKNSILDKFVEFI